MNSLTSRNILKISSTEAYNTIQKYDLICISEAYLDSSVATDDKDLCKDYNLIRAHYPSY